MDEGKVSGKLTFSQRYGYEPLPEAMQLEELSGHLRRELWNLIREFFLGTRRFGVENWFFPKEAERFIERVLGKLLGVPEDEVPTDYDRVMRFFKEAVINAKFNSVLDLLQIMANDRGAGVGFTNSVRRIFEEHAAPYILDTSQTTCFFRPRGNKEQGVAIQKAIDVLRTEKMDGATTHLREAAEHINAGQYGDAIADSIHAVESVARKIDANASRTLAPALDSLEQSGLIKHRALKEAFLKLYGYTSDEQGLRHALVDKGTRDVGVDEAMFMYGACASFCAYLVSQHRQSR